MFFSTRIRLKKLAALCRRLATSLEAGIDVRTVWQRETGRASGRARIRIGAVSQAVDRGEGLAEALAEAGGFFPPLLAELAQVGQQTGHLGEVFAQLAEHYDSQVRLRRSFLAAIAWPLVQLALAVAIVGFLIWIMGVIGKTRLGKPIDPLGLGLVGNEGLLIYIAFVAGVTLCLLFVIQAVRRGLVWTRPIQRGVLRAPVLGKALQTLALARLAWSMHLAMNTGMEVRRALKLSLQSTRNARYTDQIEQIGAEIDSGSSIHEAFERAGNYPADFLDALAVGEQSGRLVESMALLSRQYHEQARAALGTLTMLAGVAVWCAIALLIVALIFRLFMFYLGAIHDAMQM